MKKLILLAMVIGLLVSGCGLLVTKSRSVFLSPKGSWTKEGVSTKQLKKDYQDCRGQGSPIQTPKTEDIDKCMESKGYQWK